MTTADKPQSAFERLAAIDCKPYIEKKGNLAYLSWAWAVDQLLRSDPSATWTYGEPAKFGDTMMVFCTVTAFGQPRTMQLPVMDHKNKAIANPDAFAVNTAMQRCLVKAIALHGLGLYIYAGEDVPRVAAVPDDEPPELDNAVVASLESAETLADLQSAWLAIDTDVRRLYADVKDAAKRRLGGQRAA
jgi:hypothetical protein